MSGIVHNVITKRNFTLTNTTTGNTEIPLARAIDVSDAKSVQILVRVHSSTIGTGATFSVKAYAVSLTSEEPDTDFLVNGAASPTALTGGTVSISAPSNSPQLCMSEITGALGSMIRLTVASTQPAVPQSISVTISIDLVIRDN